MARKYGSSNRSNHTFSQVPKAEIQRSSFDRSSTLKTAFDAADLVPVFVDECLPGDTFNLNANFFGRLATPLKPIVDNLYLETFWFFVPNRLLWDNWEKFCGSQDNPEDSTDYTIPTIGTPPPGTDISKFLDYMGVPPVENLNISTLPLRAYNLIYNEWFRDQNLQESLNVITDDTGDEWADYAIRRRGKRQDYFTSALPWPQKGDPVTVPLGNSAEIYGPPNALNLSIRREQGGTTAHQLNVAGDNTHIITEDQAAPNDTGMLYADLSNATGFTINQLRQSFQIQRLLERDARGGTRYVEVLKSHFGVTSPDARLQRPEFLSGSSQMISINQVAQTAQDAQGGPDPETSVGNLGAFGLVTARAGFTKSFVEHGYVIGLANVRADLTYQQGLRRMWSRSTRYDFYWPVLAHLGEQAILNKEIFAQGTAADENVFGYQEAFGDYRYRPSQITGIMRSQDPASLDVWHLAQDFANLPVLGPTFIEDNPPMDRILAVPTEPDILLDAYFKLRCARPMPLYGVPGLIDHF